MKETWNKIKSRMQSVIARCYINEIATFIIGWIILFDVLGGTLIPISYGHDCGWFAIPNLIIDIWVIYKFIKWIKDDSAA